MNFKEYIAETETVDLATRQEFNSETKWNNFKHKAKKLNTINEYDLFKYKEYFFLVREDKYIAYIDSTIDKLEGQKAIFIDSAHSTIRGGYQLLIDSILKTNIKIVVSGVQLSTDATKYYKKVLKNNNIKYIIQDNTNILYKKIKFSDTEINNIFSDVSLTIGQIK